MCSTVFSDMLSDTPKLDTSSSKIESPALHSDNEILVEAMRRWAGIQVRDWNTAERLLRICGHFDINFVGSSIASQLGPLVDAAPLKIFAIASQYNDLALARMALASSHKQLWQSEAGARIHFNLQDLGD